MFLLVLVSRDLALAPRKHKGVKGTGIQLEAPGGVNRRSLPSAGRSKGAKDRKVLKLHAPRT